MSEFIIILVLVVASIGLVWLLYKANELQKNNIYVYPKTKNKYLAKGIVKMKDTLSNEWIDAVLYISLKNEQYYVRDKRQFLDKFVTLEDWEESNNGNVKSR
jgi:hypothetical protein